ncbi:MAG TPA: YbaK/EbsC family protein [Gemmataceae bacterium]|nr:YbaK/EbsC family protein [Gemmataceae bacterium]
MRIAAFLAEERVSFEFLLHPPAFTAQKRAKYLHVSGGRVGKSVLMHSPSGWLLAVLPATQRVDLRALSAALGGPVRLATGQELAAVFRDCEWGAAPPFGRLYGLQTLLEESIPPDVWLVFETHSHMEAVRIRCSDFERLERPRRLRFAGPQPRL